MAWDKLCPKCSSNNWIVVGSSNCICQDCNNVWIVSRAKALFPEKVRNS